MQNEKIALVVDNTIDSVINISECPELTHICDECGKYFQEEDGDYNTDGNFICRDCQDDLGLSFCEECGKLHETTHQTEDEHFLCERCLERNGYERCEECGMYSRDYRTQIDDIHGTEIILCEHCSDRSDSYYCEECGQSFTDHYASNYGAYSNTRECWFCENCKQEENLFEYHSDEGREFTEAAENSRFRCGFEIEKEDSEIKENINARDLLDETGWCAERDGSLDDYSGFELISPVLPLDTDYLQNEFEKIEKYIDAEYSKNCGGHIHVSDSQRTPDQIAEDVKGYLPLIYALYPERASRRYSFAYKFEELKERKGSHGVALNIGEKTVEFRIFPSPKNLKTLLWRAELLKFILENKRENFIEVLNIDIFQKSGLYTLLQNHYSEDEIKEKINLSIEFGKQFEELAPSFEFNY